MKANVNTILECVSEYLRKQMDLFVEVSDLVAEKEKDKKINGLFPLMFIINHTARSMLILSKTPYATEIFILARAFVERSVNLCYLILSDSQEFKKFIDYSLQRGFRAACSKSETAKLIGVKTKEKIPNELLKKKLDEYTSKKGRPINKWTKLTFAERLAFLNKARPDLFNDYTVALFKNLYEDASEASHGTLYGILFIMGVFQGRMCPGGIESYMCGYMALVFNNFGGLVDKMFKLIESNSSLDISKIIKQSKENDKLLDQKFEEIKKDFN